MTTTIESKAKVREIIHKVDSFIESLHPLHADPATSDSRWFRFKDKEATTQIANFLKEEGFHVTLNEEPYGGTEHGSIHGYRCSQSHSGKVKYELKVDMLVHRSCPDVYTVRFYKSLFFKKGKKFVSYSHNPGWWED